MDIFGLLTRLTAILMGCGAVLTTFPVAGQDRVIISEFMASNKKTRTDQDRQFSDWIEIYNAGATAANLEGWHLTDKRSAPTQWTFPAVTLAPNSYLVVFASQKNRRQPGAELHTNFKLAANGDYLALIKPDGVTVASEYAPAYPVQLPDVSYGLPMSEVRISLAPSNAPRRILVPSADIGTNWTRPDFDDSTWSAASGGVGYDRSTNYAGLIATDLRSEMFGKNTSVYIRTPFVASDEFSQRLKLRLHYNDGFVAYLNGEEILRRNAPAALQWNSAAAAAHGVSSPTFLEEKFESARAGYTLNQTSPKLRPRISPPTGTIPEYYLRLSNGRISGQANSVAFDQTSPGLNQTITADFDFRTKNFGPAPDSLCFLLIPTSAYGTEGAGVSLDELKDNKAPNLKGVLAVRLQFFQGQNFASVHWNGAERLNIKMPIDPTALLPRIFHHARISVQHDEKGASISVSITPDVYGRSKKTYRIFERSSLSGVFPFENRIQVSSCLGNLAGAIDLANIKVQFVSGEVSAETFDISRFTHLLRAGTNMLAIHGLNRAADDADFLIAPELVAEGMILQTNSPRYFAPATPGVANAEGFPGVSAPPHFSISGGIYTNDVSLDLRTGSASAVIRYTLDGSEPNLSSRSYAGPIRITGSSLVKAKTFELGLLPSVTRTETYTRLDESLLNFNSNLPLVVIGSSGQAIYRGRKVPVSARIINTVDGHSSLAGAADFDGRCDIHVRGHSSLHFPKHSYTFHLRDDTWDKTRVPLLGLPKESDWILYAPFTDKTLMRDVLAYELSNRMGHYASRTKFVEVFITHSNGRLTRSDYAGVYVLEEQIKRSKKRVNIDALTPGDNAEPEISGGYIFKRDHNEGNWGPGFTTSRGVHFFFVEPKAADITPQQRSWLGRYMNNFERALYGSNFTDPRNGYAAYLDVDSFIDAHWLIEVSKNIDGFRYSAFFHKDRGGKLKPEPVWDWNLSFGNADYYNAYEPTGWYTPLLRETEICWFRRLVQDPDFEQRYIDRWGELRSSLFAPSNLLNRVDEIAAQLSQAQARNFQRWPIMGKSLKPGYFVGGSYEAEVTWMKQWIRRRIAWIDSQFPTPPVFARTGGSSAGAGTLSIRASSGKTYYTLDGTDPRLPGGGISPKAHLYNSPINLTENVRVFARVLKNNGWSSPTRS